MADFPAQPAALNFRDKPTFGSSAAVNTTGLQILAADPLRRMGTWIRNTGGTNALLVGDASGTAVYSQAASAAAPPVFIPGTGAIFVKAAASTTDVCWMAY